MSAPHWCKLTWRVHISAVQRRVRAAALVLNDLPNSLDAIKNELREHLVPTALATLALFTCAFGLPAIFRAAGYDQAVQTSLPDAPVWLLVLFIVLVGPSLEELIFRKWGIDVARKLSLSFLSASLVSTALWAVAHTPANFQAGLIYTTTGLVLCRLRYMTNRLWTCVLAHIAYNTPAAFMLVWSQPGP